jgi:hypothetical protein
MALLVLTLCVTRRVSNSTKQSQQMTDWELFSFLAWVSKMRLQWVLSGVVSSYRLIGIAQALVSLGFISKVFVIWSWAEIQGFIPA